MLYWICLTFTWFCGITFSGTQRVISFLRQMMEHGGFYRTSDQAWVQFERIQFVGACNPPTDPGRKPLTHRYNAVLDQPGSLCMSFNNLICLACCNIQSLWEVYWYSVINLPAHATCKEGDESAWHWTCHIFLPQDAGSVYYVLPVAEALT